MPHTTETSSSNGITEWISLIVRTHRQQHQTFHWNVLPTHPTHRQPSLLRTSGKSGSPLTVQDKIGRFFAMGLLSFVKGRGCDIYSNNPSAYTKLSCFLPWIAKQYEMDYEPEVEHDPTCTEGTTATISKNESCLVPQDARFLKEKRTEKCQNIPSSLQEEFAGERDCIFPFYYNGR